MADFWSVESIESTDYLLSMKEDSCHFTEVAFNVDGDKESVALRRETEIQKAWHSAIENIRKRWQLKTFRPGVSTRSCWEWWVAPKGPGLRESLEVLSNGSSFGFHMSPFLVPLFEPKKTWNSVADCWTAEKNAACEDPPLFAVP